MSDMKNNVVVVASCDFNCPEDAGKYFMQLKNDPELILSDNQPDGYYLVKEGLYGIDRAGEARLIMAGYIVPVGLAADKSQSSGLSVVFYCQTTDGKVSQEIVPVVEVLSRSEVVCRHFAGKGLIPLSTVPAMNTYFRAAATLPLKRYRLVNRHGWQPGDLCFMHGRHAIKSEKITEVHGMIPAASYNPSSGIGARGSLDEWKEKVLKHATGDMQKLALWIGLSSCLLPLLNEQGIIYHFYGQSSVGKTALLQLAASVNGNGGEPGNSDSLIESWNTTPNALEMTLEQRNHITAPIDELGVYKGSKIGDAIYALANGKGKNRMSGETLKNVEPASWLLNIISSGEISMQERLRDGGETVKDGLLHRSIDLLIAPEHVRSCADESSEDCGHRIEIIKANSAQYYGTAGRAFIEYLVNLTNEKLKTHNYINELHGWVRKELLARCEVRGDQLSTVQKRLLSRFAVPGTAAFLAYDSGILEWGEDEIFATLITAFDVWMAGVQTETDPMQEALMCLQNILNTEHQNFGNLSRNPHFSRHVSVDGILLPEQQMLILPETIGIWLKNSGFNAKQIAKALDARGFLIRTEKDRLISRKPLGGKSYNGFIIDNAFLKAELV
ncbi:DUF927 domain-containing protein [Enterobacter asburiae]|uniref:DUF927 domain-containing protein n=1 Tax=Enterobacter asburiae TaxID=61645 RepID=UPI002075B634|nr:DUF927 domain-containing protein [Enterobacter asburiae]MCM7567771.1 DUF927 domain-containing protein [Enterobacter asburiae]